ncbi:MAG: DUF3300 domain-containing protein [Candidatus Korobacteraceae bacterium]
MNIIRQFVATLLTCILVAATSPAAGAQEAQQANLSSSEIDSIVSPIALYPDQLVAQILAAATYPDQVTAASNWLNTNQGLQGDALMQAADKQPWDPSVKALTQFPTVLDQMAKNLAWTSALGDAAYNQQKDVMAAIQRLRQEAKAAGNLKSGEQIKVVQQDPQTIVIQPANPQVVYVPTYSPTVVYGTPYYPPGYSTGAMVATGLLAFGAGIAVGAAINNSCCGWGWNSWGCGWHGGSVTYNRNVYVSRSNTFYGSNRQQYRNNYYGGNRPTHYNANNRYNGGNNRVNGGNNRNTNISGNNVNINGGNRNPNNNNRPNGGGNNNAGNRNPGNNNAGNRNPNLGSNNNRPGGNNNGGNRPNAPNNNRPVGNNNGQNMANRGYGQKPAAGNNSSAFGGSKPGGNARADGNRGRQSMGGGGSAPKAKPAASRGGGGGGGGGRKR